MTPEKTPEDLSDHDAAHPVVSCQLRLFVAVLTIIISGTFAGGGGIGTTTDPKVYQLNLHMYAVAGMLAFFAWILSGINTLRIQAWGWFATNLLLFGIGAVMFGLFWPTAEDIRQSRLQRAARRAAGIR